jgi:pimeloyl-ACP methyl ester carboxylesterase
MLFTNEAGLQIAYDDLGPPGGKTLVLVHGFSSNRIEGWRRTGWYAAIEKRGERLIALDLRGHGESTRSHDPLDYGHAAMAGDIVALMDHLGVDHASLIGFSLGARVALTAALDHPGRFDHLVLAGVGDRLLEAPRGAGQMAQAMLADDPEQIENPMLRSFRHFADEQGEDRAALAACSQASSRSLTADDLWGLRVPTLVIAGARDQMAGSPEKLAEAIPGARGVTLPGLDHFAIITNGMLKGQVFDFLDGWMEP